MPLNSVGLEYFNEIRSYLQLGEVTDAWETQITLSFALAFTLAIRQVLEGEEGAHD